jgi:hypothetical protein
MKTLKIITVIWLFLNSTSFIYSQDTTLYKVKIHNYQAKIRNGKISIILGASLAVIGGVLIGKAEHNFDLADKYDWLSDEYDNYSDKGMKNGIFGGTIGTAGITALVIGSINWGMGKRKLYEYKIRLDDARSGFYYKPDQIGLKLTFNF